MNYRHIFHAGNFADVFKHWILTLLLEKLISKPSAFCVLDTHAGLGIYDLQHLNAQKTLEYNSGIQRLISKQLDPAFAAYARIFNDYYNLDHTYPGSPKIIQEFLRGTDRMFLSELHEEDYQTLSSNFSNAKNVKIFKQNGYIMLKANLPPIEKRGLVFIDPPFEQTDEFAQILIALQNGLARFANGMYAIWYPIKDRNLVQKFYAELTQLPVTKALYVEIHTNEQVLKQLNSCGMVIINPPWELESQLHANLPKLLEYLDLTVGSYNIEWLVHKD